MKNLSKVICFSLFGFATWGSLSGVACQIDSPEPGFVHTPEGHPSYIFALSPDGETILYHNGSSSLHDLSNREFGAAAMIHVGDEGCFGAEMHTPGYLDPSMTTDGRFYNTPMKHSFGNPNSKRDRTHWKIPTGTSFYKMEDIEGHFDRTSCEKQSIQDSEGIQTFVNNGRRANPLEATVSSVFRDQSFRNHYHTNGTYTDEEGKTIYRVMNDLDGASMRDYIYDEESGELKPHGPVVSLAYHETETEDFDRLHNQDGGLKQDFKWNPYPRTYNTHFDLPMLSKDGKYFTVYDRRTGTTKMFEIVPSDNPKKPWTRREVLDFGVETGKVQIDYENSRVTFHMDFVDPAQGDKMTGVSDGRGARVPSPMTKDVFVADLESIQTSEGQKFDLTNMRRITTSTKTGYGSYYPSFDRNGNIVFLSNTFTDATGGITPGGEVQYSFVQVDPDDYKASDWNLDNVAAGHDNLICLDGRAESATEFLKKLSVLGNLWFQMCGDIVATDNLTMNESESLIPDLTPREALTFSMNMTPEQCKGLVNFARLKEEESPFLRALPESFSRDRNKDIGSINSGFGIKTEERRERNTMPDSFANATKQRTPAVGGADWLPQILSPEDLQGMSYDDLEWACNGV